MTDFERRDTNYAVFFESKYGSTEAYAKECARQLGGLVHSLDDESALSDFLDRAQSARMVALVFSPTYAGKVEGTKIARKLVKKLSAQAPGIVGVALAAVGMTPLAEARKKDHLVPQLGADADRIARFYLPGNLEYSRLSRVHRSVMWGIVKMLQRKSDRSVAEQNMIDSYDKDTIGLDLAELQPIVEWARACAS